MPVARASVQNFPIYVKNPFLQLLLKVSALWLELGGEGQSWNGGEGTGGAGLSPGSPLFPVSADNHIDKRCRFRLPFI